jgi:hypothetical protein
LALPKGEEEKSMINDEISGLFLGFIIDQFVDDKDPLGYELESDENIDRRVLEHYLPVAQSKSDAIKRECLGIMKRSCDDNEDHSKLRDWQGALLNIILFCILPTVSYHETEELLKQPHDSLRRRAISAIIRFSRWYHTDSGFWKRFKPYAQKIGKLLWGNMEVLNLHNP